MQAHKTISDGHSWYAETVVLAPERPRLTFDLDVDVCVIGGGLAGLTVAREVARRGWSVALLEAQTVASGASGRNVGFVLPGFMETIDRIIERVGMEQAKELWALSERGVEYVRDTIRDTNMPGVTPADGWLQVAKFRHDPALNKTATLLSEQFGAQVGSWSAEQVGAVLKSPLYRNGMHFPRAFTVHPVNYVQGLAAAAEQAGVRIFEHTPALSLDPAGIRKRIGTPSARVRAAQVVLAGNTGLEGLMPRLAASLLPVTSYVVTTVPLGDKLREAVTYQGGVSDTDFMDNHYRITGGDRLVCSGGLTTWQSDPKRFVRRLARDIRRAFPQLGSVAIDHVWSGTTGSPVHKMPQIGEIAPGVWVSNGYGGQGYNTSAVAGELIAAGIVEGDESWRAFSSYDLVWAGGKTGRSAMQVYYWSCRFRDRFDAVFNNALDAPEEAVPFIEAASLSAGDAMPVAPAVEPIAESVVVPVPEPLAAAPAEQKPGNRRPPRKPSVPKAAKSPAKRASGPKKPRSGSEPVPQICTGR